MQTLTIDQLQSQIDQLKTELESDLSLPSEEVRIKYMSKKGKFNELAKALREVDDKKTAGQLLNELKTHIEDVLTDQLTNRPTDQLSWQDLTIPGIKPNVGHMHPVSQAMEEITGIFEKIGFTRVRYPEIDWDWYVFESLNMPPDHPARDEWETFFIDTPDTTKETEYDQNDPRKRHPSLVGGKQVLTTHTSNGQVREMERLESKPPIRMINIGRCYRRQQDATHTQMFHQFEGLVVDKGINIQHLKGTLDHFAKEFYGPTVKSRIRPFHFQFTEPSFEVDFSCHICGGTGYLSPSQGENIESGSADPIRVDGVADSQTREERAEGVKNADRNKSFDSAQDDAILAEREKGIKCRFCKSGWHEVGGAGMVHPNVLKAGGIDPEEYTGFAFGWGVERTYTLKEGLNIDDIRLLYSGDLKFLRQF